MKYFFGAVLFATAFISCAGSSEEEGNNHDSTEDTNDETSDDDIKFTGDCGKKSVADWDNFIGIKYKTNELDLEKIIGNFTGGEYTADSSAFIYYFKRVDRAPVTVWVNGKTGDVETIFMEILGYEEYFEGDVDAAVEEFNIQDCDSKWFGMTPQEVIDAMGKPAKDEMKEDKEGQGVRSISYDSEDYKISVNFKFYDSQGGICSSISLNWFY
ncbi:MAG: hypothetical protein H6582_14815 [Crocinitomicaceae bacterium]|nr:hypothetical protein [Crocinitomicaceae bacterium]